MQYNFPRAVALSALQGAGALARAIEAGLEPGILDEWAGALKRFEPARAERVAALEAQLETLSPGLAGRLDEWVADSSRRKQAAGIEPLLVSDAPLVRLFWDFAYWKYSIDHRGRGNGLTRGMRERLIRGPRLIGSEVFDPLVCPWTCPNCGEDAALSTHSLASPPESYRHDLELRCDACGHFERQHHRIDEVSVLQCTCARCARRRDESWLMWRDMSVGTWKLMALDLTRQTRDAIAALGVAVGGPLPPAAMQFARMLWDRPEANLLETAGAYQQSQSRYNHWHPFSVRDEFWRVAPALVGAGVLEVVHELRVDLADGAAVLEAALLSRARLRTDDEETSRRLARATTTAMVGPRSSDRTALTHWVEAVYETGLVDGWLELPCDFWFSVNRDRVRELYEGDEPATDEPIYLYRCVPDAWFELKVDGASRIGEIANALRRGPLLQDAPAPLLRRIRETTAPDMAARAQRAIEAKYGDLVPLLDQFEEAMRGDHAGAVTLPAGVSLSTPAGKAVANYCYWKLCREAVGKAGGIPLAWVMRPFHCQAVQFRKVIEEASAEVACPRCGVNVVVSGITLRPPHNIGSANLHCESCGHVERALRDLPCECAGCSAAVRGYLAEARLEASGIVNRVVEAYLARMSDAPEASVLFGRVPQATSRVLAMSYAVLREGGHAPSRCASLLLSGTVYLGEHADWSPRWVAEFVGGGLFTAGATERLEGDAARAFVREALRMRLHEHTESYRGASAVAPATVAQVEDALMSEDAARFVEGARWLRVLIGGQVVLPMRRRCVEVRDRLEKLAREARETGVEPAHVAKGHWKQAPESEEGMFSVPPWPAGSDAVMSSLPELEIARANALGGRLRSAEYAAGVAAASAWIEAERIVPNPYPVGTAAHDAFESGRAAFEVALAGARPR